MKQKSLLTGLFIFLFTLLTIFLSEIIFDEWRQAIIAGLLVGILATLFEIRVAIQSTGETTVNSTKEYSERLLSYLNLRNVYSENDWLLGILQKIVELKQVSEQQLHDLTRFQGIITQALERARSEIGTPYRVTTGDNELQRIILLNEAVLMAKEYIYAVSFDAYGYLERFWSAEVFSKQYNASNIEAAKRGAQIERIFIVEKKVMDGSDKEKKKRLMSQLRLQRRASRNIHVYVAIIEDLPESLKGSNTSFIVSDDYVGSESNGISDGKPIQGYVSYSDREGVIEPLKQRFTNLKLYAKRV